MNVVDNLQLACFYQSDCDWVFHILVISSEVDKQDDSGKSVERGEDENVIAEDSSTKSHDSDWVDNPSKNPWKNIKGSSQVIFKLHRFLSSPEVIKVAHNKHHY